MHIIAVHIVVLQLTEQTPVVDALHTLKQHVVILMLTGQTKAVDVHHIPQHHVATDTEHVPYAHHMDLQAVVLLILKQHVVLPIAHITTHAAERTAQARAVQVIGAIKDTAVLRIIIALTKELLTVPHGQRVHKLFVILIIPVQHVHITIHAADKHAKL